MTTNKPNVKENIYRDIGLAIDVTGLNLRCVERLFFNCPQGIDRLGKRLAGQFFLCGDNALQDLNRPEVSCQQLITRLL